MEGKGYETDKIIFLATKEQSQEGKLEPLHSEASPT